MLPEFAEDYKKHIGKMSFKEFCNFMEKQWASAKPSGLERIIERWKKKNE